jgi:ABC-type amino acid transport system permease subunit
VNFKLKDILPQLVTVVSVVLVFGFFANNASINMENRGIDFGFGFLSQAASFDVQFSSNSIRWTTDIIERESSRITQDTEHQDL